MLAETDKTFTTDGLVKDVFDETFTTDGLVEPECGGEIILRVNGVDRTDQVEWTSLEKTEVLTKEPDTLRFSLRNYGSKTFRPELDDEVTLHDGATKVFGGIVIDTSDEIEGKLKFLSVNCKDFTHTLDRKLVARTYEGMTAEDIIDDIVSNFVEAGFTTTNVNAPVVVEKIVFNYLTVSESLKKLAGMLGEWDWYVDYNKDIHFFQPALIGASFNLTDTSETYIWNSLKIDKNTNQLRNHIIIRGGDVEGSLVSNVQVADGVQRVFFVGYSLALATLLIQKALAATPTTFVTQTVGRDGVDNAASFNCLYNPDDGLVIFPEATKPAVNDRIKSEGFPIFPLIAEKQDLVSVGVHGTFQYLIVDKTIRSRDAASQRADAELLKYANVSNYCSFITHRCGLRTGQTINISSVIRDFNQDFRIERITTRFRTPTALQYEVSGLASEDVTMVDVLNKLLITDVADQIAIGENEVVDRIYSAFEDITLSEAFTTAKSADASHNPQSETITLTETDVEQPLNYATIFVAGAYIPTISFGGADTKRVFVAGGSYAG